MSGVVTGEAVVVPLDVARLPSRAMAFAVDAAIQLLVALAGVWALTTVINQLDSAASAAVLLTLTVTVLVGVPVTWETLSRGRSPGKALLGLRVVRDDGGPIRFRHALVRALLAVFVDVWVSLGLVALVVSSLSDRGKRVGDLLAGTLVVRERVRIPTAPIPPMPPPLAAWAATLDLSGLGDQLALAIRSFLARTGELSPSARVDTATRLARMVAQRVSAPPPVGVPAEAYLAAVVAERRRRELERERARRASLAQSGDPWGLPAQPGEPWRFPAPSSDVWQSSSSAPPAGAPPRPPVPPASPPTGPFAPPS